MRVTPAGVRRRRPDRTAKTHIPPPVGGLNTIDPGYSMPEFDCPLLYNMIGAENGLRARLGYKEWCTGVGSSLVPTIIPFSGSSADGSKDRLFALSTGTAKIYSVGSSSATPTAMFTLASSTGDSGWGVSHSLVSSSGQHFAMYFDEQNGYHVYSETNDTWRAPTQQTSVAWTKNTAVTINVTRVLNKGVSYLCSQSGTTVNTDNAGPTGVGTAIADGTATWDYEPTINGVDPAKFVFGTVWKNFALFVEKDSSRMWFSSTTNALYGTVTSWDFGSKFKHGGSLVGLWSWTVDGGIGIDDYLVAVSSGGDVVIYSGTDPNAASTFFLRGVWFVGGVPKGRRIATDFGGDLLILSNLGVIPLSRLVNGTDANDTSQYATRNIGNLFNRSVSAYGTTKGWSLRLHPEDAALLITLPAADGAYPQLAMSVLTKGWAQYRDLPMIGNEAWLGKLYFGTNDGRVCQHTGYIDNLNLAQSSYSAVQCSLITSFQNEGNGRQKQLQSIRPTVLSESGAAINASARYRYDLTEASAPNSSSTNASNVWDTGLWDTARWGGAFQTQQIVFGASGMGPDVAVAIRIAATSRTVLVGVDVTHTEGGQF